MDESEERIIMREKVLIVDDIELNREILAVALGDNMTSCRQRMERGQSRF